MYNTQKTLIQEGAMIRSCRFLIFTVLLLFSTSALAQESPDVSFAEENDLDREVDFCFGATSLMGRSTAVLEKSSSNQLRLTVMSTANGNNVVKNETDFSFTNSDILLEISDTGPIGSQDVNVLFSVRHLSGAPILNLSTQSGAEGTFTPLNFVVDGFYPYLAASSIAYVDGPHGVKFGPDGKLYAIYWTSVNMGVGPVAINFAIWDENPFDGVGEIDSEPGNPIHHEIIGTNGFFSDPIGSFASIAVTHNNVVAVYQPGTEWRDDGLNHWYYVPESFVYDVSSSQITDRIHIGEVPPASEQDSYYNNPFDTYPTLGAPTANLTSDGKDVYYMTYTGVETNGSGNDINVLGFWKFDEYSPGKFFPDDYNPVGGLPLTDLSTRTTLAKSIDFMTNTDAPGAQGSVYGFAAPRYSSNYLGDVSVLFLPPTVPIENLSDHFKITFNPDIGTSGIVPRVVEDATQAAMDELFGIGLKGAFTGGKSAGNMTSSYMGTTAFFCSELSNLEGPFSLWTKAFINFSG